MWQRVVPGEVVIQRVFRVLLYGDGVGGIFLGCQPVGVVTEEVEGDGLVMFPAVEAVLAVLRWAGHSGGRRLGEDARVPVGVLPEEVVFRAPFLVAPSFSCLRHWRVARASGSSSGRVGSIARCPRVCSGCVLAWCRQGVMRGCTVQKKCGVHVSGWWEWWGCRSWVRGFCLLLLLLSVLGVICGHGAGLHGVIGFLWL